MDELQKETIIALQGISKQIKEIREEIQKAIILLITSDRLTGLSRLNQLKYMKQNTQAALKILRGLTELPKEEVEKMAVIKNGRLESTIQFLRKKYGGRWIYRGQSYWEHIDKGHVVRVAILGGINGDDYVGSELIYYPKNGSPERVM